MLVDSRLYSFLDNQNNFSVHFLEGQKLISDLVIMHNSKGNALQYFRDTVLSAQQMIQFLKVGESIGFYIDSEEPYLRFKIETNYQGLTRTLLLPEELNEFPNKITGSARLTKLFNNQNAPYTSVTQLDKTSTSGVVNKVLKDSYQTDSEIFVSQDSDQSIMISKLPTGPLADDQLTAKEYFIKNQSFYNEVFSAALNDVESVVQKFEATELAYLGSKVVKFHCPCSKERMVENIRNLHINDLDELFKKENPIQVRCDYCTANYPISQDDL